MRLVVHASGLEVVVPRGARREQAERFVEGNREWALRTLKKVCGRIPFPLHDAYSDLPLFAHRLPDPTPKVTTINLRSLGRIYTVHYIRVPLLRNRATLLPPSDTHNRQINIYCADPEAPPHTMVADLLREWLRDKARSILPETVNTIADEVGLRRPTTIRLGFQRTVWGSRSASGRISLNIPLLFFPPNLLRHVIIHELCHAVHMNHGTRFKNLLNRLDPDSERLAAALNRAEAYIPPWVLQ